MRIGFDARKAPDFGIGTHIQGLLRELAEIPFSHQLVVFYRAEADRALLPSGSGPIELVRDPSPSYSLRELWSLPRTMRARRLQLFHTPHYVLPPFRPCPAVVTVHDLIHLLFPRQLPSRLAFLYAHAMLRYAARSSVVIITVSEATRADLERVLHIPPAKIRVVPNGVDPRFRPSDDPVELRATLSRLGVPERYVLFVGNPKPHKNLPRLLRAFRPLADRDPLVRLVVVGVATEEIQRQVGQWTAEACVEGRVVVLGNLPATAMPTLYQGALCLAIPSLYEGFGLPALEAMASGTPVVASTRGALPEVVGDAGLLVEPESVDGIGEALYNLHGQPALREVLKARGVERAKRFTWRRSAELTVQVWEEAAGSRSSSS